MISLLVNLSNFAVFTLSFRLLVADLNQFEGSRLEVLFMNTHFTAFAEQSFRGSAELILKNLLALKIGTLGARHELITVVLVTNFKVIKSVKKSLNLFLALLHLGIELITIALQLLFLLSCLDNVVSL